MKKDEFLAELRIKLKRLPKEETESAIEYYGEYIDDADTGNEEAVIAEIGSPAHVASQILADYAVNEVKMGAAAKKGIPSVFFIVLAILAAPIALPVAITFLAFLLTVVIVAAAILLACFAAVFGLLAGGLFSIIGGLLVLPTSPATTLFFAGLGLAIIGIGSMLSVPCVLLARKSFFAIARLAASMLNKLQKRKVKTDSKGVYDK